MFTNITPKAIALGTASGLVMIAMAMGVEITKAQLFEIRKSIGALEEGLAAREAAAAQKLDANNRLQGTLETAGVMDKVGQLQANAMIVAAKYAGIAATESAKTTGEKLVEATNINMHPENEMYDNVTGPLFGEPTKRIKTLNDLIVRSRREAKSGIDRKTRRPLTESERSDRLAQEQWLEEELEIVQETSSKNFSDILSVAFGGMTSASSGNALFGRPYGGSRLYPSGNEPMSPTRFIVPER